MLINENSDFNNLVKFILRYDTDWNIFTALNCKEGIARAQIYQPDVILLNLVMPKQNGLNVYTLLRSNWTTFSIPVIFFTAMVGMEKKITLQITEDEKVISMPFNIIKLKDEVIKVCTQHFLLGKKIQVKRNRKQIPPFQIL